MNLWLACARRCSTGPKVWCPGCAQGPAFWPASTSNPGAKIELMYLQVQRTTGQCLYAETTVCLDARKLVTWPMTHVYRGRHVHNPLSESSQTNYSKLPAILNEIIMFNVTCPTEPKYKCLTSAVLNTNSMSLHSESLANWLCLTRACCYIYQKNYQCCQYVNQTNLYLNSLQYVHVTLLLTKSCYNFNSIRAQSFL